MVDRISTFAQHQRAVDDIGKLQTDLAKLSDQISSGRAAATFTELGGNISRSLDLESSINSISRFVDGNKIVLSRLKTMDLAVSKIEQVAADLAGNLVLERSSGNALNLREFARAALSQVQDSLNSNQAGRFLFAGGKTATPPVSGLTINSNIIDGDATANYYAGDDLVVSVKASSELEINYGIKANDVAFRNLIGALNLAIEAEDNANSSGISNSSDLDDALDMVNDAIDELARVRNQVNSDILTLDGVNTQHERVKTQLNTSLTDIIATDVVGASIEVSLNEAILTATMQSFVRISGLTLSDFLR